MANDVFNIRTDIKIEFYIPAINTFIWGVNYWDDGGVWDTNPSSAAWTDLLCESFDITLNKGCEVESGIFVSPSSSTATIRMQGATYDPFSSGLIHAGTQIRISAETLPDTIPGYFEEIWNGYIRNYSATYNQEGNNVVTIHAVDAMQDFLNRKVGSYVVPALTKLPSQVITDMANTYYTGIVPNSNADMYYLAAKTYTNTTVGEIINDCLTASLGALWLQRDGTMRYASEEDLASIIGGFSFEFSSIHSLAADHICMTELVMKADSRDLPNEVIATNSAGGQLTQRNQDAYDLYGAVSLDVDVPMDDVTGLQLWLNRLNLTTTLRRVESLSFDAASRPGQLWYWWQVDRLFDPNIVTYDVNGIVFTDTYFVTRQIDRITPTSWTISVELWRGI